MANGMIEEVQKISGCRSGCFSSRYRASQSDSTQHSSHQPLPNSSPRKFPLVFYSPVGNSECQVFLRFIHIGRNKETSSHARKLVGKGYLRGFNGYACAHNTSPSHVGLGEFPDGATIRGCLRGRAAVCSWDFSVRAQGSPGFRQMPRSHTCRTRGHGFESCRLLTHGECPVHNAAQSDFRREN
jgi:hypothetical protein